MGELRCWEKNRRLKVGSFKARKFFSAWRGLAEQGGRGRLQRLIDIAHDSWHACYASVQRAMDRHVSAKYSAIESRCFLEWLWHYQKSRQLARFWRWLGKDRKLLRWCFLCYLRAVSAGRRDRIELMEKVMSVAQVAAVQRSAATQNSMGSSMG